MPGVGGGGIIAGIMDEVVSFGDDDFEIAVMGGSALGALDN